MPLLPGVKLLLYVELFELDAIQRKNFPILSVSSAVENSYQIKEEKCKTVNWVMCIRRFPSPTETGPDVSADNVAVDKIVVL